jgi:DNA-binding NarL/FixJ family response regulator
MDAFRSAIAGDVTFDENPPDDGGLTVAELEVLELLGQGRQAAQIADELYLSLHAIRARIKTMLRKLDVSSQLEAVAKATRMGLIVPPTMGTEQSSDDS